MERDLAGEHDRPRQVRSASNVACDAGDDAQGLRMLHAQSGPKMNETREYDGGA